MKKQLKFWGNNSKRWVSFGAVFLGIAMLLCGCGSSTSKFALDSSSYGMTEEIDYDMPETAPTEMKANGFVSGGSEAAMEEMGTAKAEDLPKNDQRKLIKTVDMTVETREFDNLVSFVQTRVEELGGYIESMESYNGNLNYRGTRDAYLVLRIPEGKLDSFLGLISEKSNVVRRSDSVEDVTLQYVDLESRKKALNTELDRLLKLLEKAESVEDIIVIEDRLSNVRYELESMESRLRTFDNQINYSTVQISISEVEVLTPVKEETIWERVSGGFVHSLQAVGTGIREVGIWIVINLPFLVVWAVLIIGAFFAGKAFLHRGKKKPAKEVKKESQTKDEKTE